MILGQGLICSEYAIKKVCQEDRGLLAVDVRITFETDAEWREELLWRCIERSEISRWVVAVVLQRAR